MKIYFLGTCAGTEPMPQGNHMSFCIEEKGIIYWFDAGEGCSRTAHLMGVDLLSVKNIIISHTHMDHVGGLANLLWNIRKLSLINGMKPRWGDIDLYIPEMETYDGIRKILIHTEGGFKTEFEILAHDVADGVLFDDGVMCVKAYHNHHLKKAEAKPWRSFSYRIETENVSVVYSGDVGEYKDLDSAIGSGCDAVIIETGHFGIDKAAEYLKEKKVGRVFFSHNGREILNHPEESARKVKACFKDGIICEDKMVIEIV